MNIAVVGTGLIGTCVALGAQHVGHEVFLVDANAEHLATAIEMGAGQVWNGQEVDLIVVAVPPVHLEEVITHNLRTNPQSTVMDVGSIKANVQAKIQGLGPLASRFVPTHPMAGRETTGPRDARADLFADRVWVICPGAEDLHLQRAKDLVTDLGASAVLMDAQAHDRAVATTSHLTQLVSSALAAQLLEMDLSSIAISGQGLRDVTRLAGSDPALWEQILAGNAAQVGAVLERMSAQMSAVAQELLASSSDQQRVLSTTRQLLEHGRQGRERIPGRHGTGAEPLAVVAVQVSDEPGALAKVFVSAGDLGINLLDVRIDHLWGRPSGLIELSVDPAQESQLRTGLLAQGFDVRA